MVEAVETRSINTFGVVLINVLGYGGLLLKVHKQTTTFAAIRTTLDELEAG